MRTQQSSIDYTSLLASYRTYLETCGMISFVLYQKRLERGRFEFPTDAFNAKTGALSWKYFILMMEGVRLKSAKFNRRHTL